MVRAGEASGALAIVFERLAEFERSRDDLRSYIISSMIYPALLATVGLASISILLNFVVPRFATIFEGSSHEDARSRRRSCWPPARIVRSYWWMAALAVIVGSRWLAHLHATAAGRSGGTAPG